MSSQSTDEELSEDDFLSQSSSQWSPTEGDAHSQWSATRVELELQCSAAKQEQTATEEGHDLVIPQESSPLTDLWNVSALKKAAASLRARYKRPAICVSSHSPVASNSSSPSRYEYAYRPATASDENDDHRHCVFTPFGILDGEEFDLIDFKFLPQVGYMIQQHRFLEPGNPQSQVYAGNFALLDRFLYDHFASSGLSIDKWIRMDASEFTCQLANDCAMDLRIATRLICLMSNKLDNAECESFGPDHRGIYFELCARRIVEGLIEAADSISNLEWTGSHICQMLVLYKATDDILTALGCPSDSDRIVQQMRVNFTRIFDGIKYSIYEDLNGSECTSSQVVHPVTKFLIRCMKLLASHSRTVQDTCICDGSSSLGDHLSGVITYWAEQLGTHFMSYNEGRNYILLLNNLTHFDEEAVKFIKDLMPSSDPISDPCDILKSLIDMNKRNYLVECWGPVKDCIKLDSGVQPSWSSLDAFTLQFNIFCKRQKKWVLQTQFKRKLRQQIEEFLVTDYDIFLQRLHKRAFSCLNIFVRKHRAGQQTNYMSTEELRCAVREIFELEHEG